MKQEPVVRLWWDSQWNTITRDVLVRRGDGIAIGRGVADELQDAPPATCQLSLKNNVSNITGTTGRYSPRNPNSDLHGKIGRNTPLQVYTGTPHVGDADFSLTDSTSHVAPSVDSPTDDGLLICGWGTPEFDFGGYTLPGSMTTRGGGGSSVPENYAEFASEAISAAGATGTRTATFPTADQWCAVSVLLHGSSPTIAQNTSGALRSYTPSTPPTVGDWVVMIAYWQWDGDELGTELPDFPFSSRQDGWIPLADTGIQNPADADADYFRMRAWAMEVKAGGEHTFGVDSSTDVTQNCLWAAVSGVGEWDIRYEGEVDELPPRWDVSGNDLWVPIEAADMTRRLGRDPPLKSPLYREVTSSKYDSYRIAYWPCEDGSDATQIAGGTPETPAMRLDLDDLNLAAYTGFQGSGALPTCTAVSGIGSARIPRYSGDFFYRGLFAVPDAGLTNGAQMVAFSIGGGTVDEVELEYGTGGSGTLNVRLFDPDDSELDATGAINFEVNGTQFLVSVELVQDGSDIDWLLFVRKVFDDGSVESPGSLSQGTFTGLTMGTARRIWIGGGGTDGMSFGHQMLGTSQALVFNISDALTGWHAEHAGRRFLRLCREQGVPASMVGDPGDTLPMGTQATAGLMALLRECARTDDGIMYTPRQFRGLVMRTGASMYNQPVVHSQAYDAGGLTSLEPLDDSRYTANKIMAESTNGDSALAVQTTGHLNVNDPADDPDGVGPYETGLSVNTMSGTVLENRAGWRRHRGTVDEYRFPQIVFDLDADTSIITTVARLDVGDRFAITSPPAWIPPEVITQLGLGYQELIGSHRRLIVVNAVPESPYRIATVDHVDFQFAISQTATLAEDLDTTETGVDITCGGDGAWTYESDFEILVGGERMTVTAVGAASGTFPSQTQTLTVTRSVNGIVKTHSTGDAIEFLYQPAIGL